MSTARPLRSRRFPRLFALVLACGGVLAACNSLTGVNDLTIAPGGVGVAGSGQGTGGTGGNPTGGSGAGNNPAGGAQGTGGDPVVGGLEGNACEDSCVSALVCVFGKCRKPCKSDADMACVGTSCLTSFATQRSGCRLSDETCKDGVGTGVLKCGPDNVLRAACDGGLPCRGDQQCISGTCIGGADESSTPWGKCGKQGKECQGAKLVACDVGGAPGPSAVVCPTEKLCLGSEGRVCDVCEQAQARCEVEVGSNKVSGERCNTSRTGFDTEPCGDLKPAQCNPATGACAAILVDAYEVTRRDYADFRKKVGDTPAAGSLRPQACAFNTSYAPDAACLAKPEVCARTDGTCDKHPQVCVDWCDAFAFCAERGQHLCGSIKDGTMVPFADFGDPGKSEWSNACTAGGKFKLAIDSAGDTLLAGDPVEGQRCATKYKSVPVPGPELTYPVDSPNVDGCKHAALGYANARNLLGNVREWENSCAATPDAGGGSDECRTRGLSYVETKVSGKPVSASDTPCAAAEAAFRSRAEADLGFRCCGKKL